MALLSSPSPASTAFHQDNAPTRTASLSETHLGQSDGGPPRGPTNGRSSGQTLLNPKNGRISPQDSNGLEIGLVNGHAGRHVASYKSNNESLEPQSISRSRTDNHQTFPHRPKASMIRSKTSYEPENISPTREASVEEHGELRHGWEDEYNSSEFLGHLNSAWLYKYPTKSTESG